MPFSPFFPSWIEAGAACLGMGSNLITEELVAKGDWAGLTERIAACLQIVQGVREAARTGK